MLLGQVSDHPAGTEVHVSSLAEIALSADSWVLAVGCLLHPFFVFFFCLALLFLLKQKLSVNGHFGVALELQVLDVFEVLLGDVKLSLQ